MQELKKKNKFADQEAKKCAKLLRVAELNLEQFFSNAKRKINEMKDFNWQFEWQGASFSRAVQTYVELDLKPKS